MKCVINKSTKTVDRVKDDAAASMVQAGTHSYVSKSAWKRFRKGDETK